MTQTTAQADNVFTVTQWTEGTRVLQKGANDRRARLIGPLANACVESGCQIAALVAAARANRPIRHR